MVKKVNSEISIIKTVENMNKKGSIIKEKISLNSIKSNICIFKNLNKNYNIHSFLCN